VWSASLLAPCPRDRWRIGGKLIGDVPSAPAILDRFLLHHAEIIYLGRIDNEVKQRPLNRAAAAACQRRTG
jgi:hypothetical protein